MPLKDEIKNKIIAERKRNPFVKVSFLSKKYHVSSSTINQIFRKNNLTTKELTGLRFRKYDVNDNYFNKIDSHEKAYLLGVWYSDGYLVREGPAKTKRIGLDVIDTDWLIEIGKELKSEAPIYKTAKESIKRFKITSPTLYDDLIKLGCVEQKTFLLKFPTPEQVPRKFIMSFILGLTDGDGSIFITKRGDFGWSITGTKEICEGCQDFLGLKHIKLNQRFPERNNNNYYLAVHGINNVASILMKLYKNAPSFCLKRKKEKYERIINDSRVCLRKQMLIPANPDGNGV